MRKRRDDEPPAAIRTLGWRYHHVGIPYTRPRAGERHLEGLGLHVSGFETSPYGIEWMRFRPDCRAPDLVKTVPHVAFAVDDLEKALQGKEVLIDPNSPSPGVRVAFIVDDGAPVELLEFSKPMHFRRKSKATAEQAGAVASPRPASERDIVSPRKWTPTGWSPSSGGSARSIKRRFSSPRRTSK